MRKFAGEYDDVPGLKKRVVGFIGQEAVHGQQHRELNDRLIEMGYVLARIGDFKPGSRREKMLIAAENLLPRKLHLALTAAAEHYTAVFAEKILSNEEIQAIPGDPEVWNLLNWHVYEELEHQSVAFDVYRAVGGSERMRVFAMGVMYYTQIPLFVLLVLLSAALDRTAWHPIKIARQTYGFMRGPFMDGLLRELRVYMKRDFHPDDIDTNALLERWRDQLFGKETGLLVDRLK